MSRKYNSATARLRQDYVRLKKDPVPYLIAEPLPSNILEWHYVVTGPENTPYEGGLYHGRLVFPSDFPYKPPSIYMLTPNGRFKCHTRLCLSISDFHPDTWNPAWSVSTILTGLLSFMVEKNPTLGSIETSDYEKRQLAWKSGEYNYSDKQFCRLFPELVKEIKQELEQRRQDEKTSGTGCTDGIVPSAGLTTGTLRFQNRLNQDQGIMGSALANLVVIVGFAAFAFSVKYVLKSLAQ